MTQIQPMLVKLGELTKMGAEFSWTILIKQQYVEGFTSLFIAIISILVIIFGYKLFKWRLEQKCMGDDGFIYVAAGFIIAIGTGLMIGFTIDAIYNLVNPEYQAIKEIFHLIKINTQ